MKKILLLFTDKRFFMLRVVFIYGAIALIWANYEEFKNFDFINWGFILLFPLAALVIGFFLMFPLSLVDVFCENKTMEIINKYNHNEYNKFDVLRILEELKKQNKIKENTYAIVYYMLYYEETNGCISEKIKELIKHP